MGDRSSHLFTIIAAATLRAAGHTDLPLILLPLSAVWIGHIHASVRGTQRDTNKCAQRGNGPQNTMMMPAGKTKSRLHYYMLKQEYTDELHAGTVPRTRITYGLPASHSTTTTAVSRQLGSAPRSSISRYPRRARLVRNSRSARRSRPSLSHE